MLRKKLEVSDIRITGVQLSGDAENWEEARDMNYLGGLDSALAHFLDLITNGERVFCRTRYVDIYSNGKNGLPKTGAIYELLVQEVQPLRRIIEGQKIEQKQVSDGEKEKGET